MVNKKLFLNLALVFISILIFLIFFEILLRLNIPKYDERNLRGLFQYSELYGWETKPNLSRTLTIPERSCLVETNSEGWRDYEHSLEKEKNKKRIIIIGDSFTWGVCVDNNETYAKILEEYDNKIETINMGVGGYGTDQEYLTIMNKGIKYNPDMVIIMYMVSSDVVDVNTNFMNWYKPQFKVIGNELVLTNVPVPIRLDKQPTKKVPFIKSFAIYPFVRDRLLSIPPIRDFLIEHFHLGRYYDFKENYNVVFRIFLKLKQDLDEKGIPLFVIIMPDQDQIRGIVSDKSIYYMQDFFEENNLSYINMYDYFKGKEADYFYFKKDGHINTNGHIKVAEAIYKKLKEDGKL